MIFLDWLFPHKCVGCRQLLGRKTRKSLCESCLLLWKPLPESHCQRCAHFYLSGKSHLCADCLKHRKACCRVMATTVYRGLSHDLLWRFKYRGEEMLADFLGMEMTTTLKLNTQDRPDMLIPVPLHSSRLRERGYHQALLLARVIGRKTGIQVEATLLKKIRKTKPQAELQGEERRENLRKAFVVSKPELIQNKHILLVDDVYTTGTTIETLAHLLVRAGAKKVEALVLARAG